jgi:hypothetical protein
LLLDEQRQFRREPLESRQKQTENKINRERTNRMINSLNQTAGWMRPTRTKSFILAALIAGAMAMPFLMPAQKAFAGNDDSDRDGNSEPLPGTWLLQVSLDPSSVPPGSVLQFTIVPTFDVGGGVVQGETGIGPGGVGGGSEAHGNWVKIGHHRYASTTRAPDYDDAHHFTGERKVKNTYTINRRGDELTGFFRLDLSLADGTILPFHPAGTYQGVRMPIEPLN